MHRREYEVKHGIIKCDQRDAEREASDALWFLTEKPSFPICHLENDEHADNFGVYVIRNEKEYPLYVGKAEEMTLRARLREHARKIYGRKNIYLKNIKYTYLRVEANSHTLNPKLAAMLAMNITAKEKMFIEIGKIKGLLSWNSTGFGNHDQGAGRREQKPSPWDSDYPANDSIPLNVPSSGDVFNILYEARKSCPFLFKFPKQTQKGIAYVKLGKKTTAKEVSIEAAISLSRAEGRLWQATLLPEGILIYPEVREWQWGKRLWPNKKVMNNNVFSNSTL